MKTNYLTKSLLLFIMIIFCLTACKSDEKKVKNPAEIVTQEGVVVPRADENLVRNLFNNVDQIDYIYNSFDFSMSISEPNAIKSNIATLSGQEIGILPANCKPVGRQMFMAKGEMLAEADLYFTPGCQFLVFVEKEKPISGSMFNEQGILFYTNVFRQAQGATQ